MIKSLLFAAGAALCAAGPTLDEYVWAPDDHYGWVDMGPDHVLQGQNIFKNQSWTGYTLNMTSQQWLTDADFAENSDTKSIWWHYLVVIVPDNVNWKRNGTMWITGWSNTASPPTAKDEDIALAASIAMEAGIITGSLFQVPNEHTIFASDPLQKSRTEDAIIAFTWDHFLNNPDDSQWLLRFPMVKASLRAMDAIKEFTAQKFPDEGYSLDYFSVAGASKRGWTTWDVGVVDPERVMAIVPIVLDAINFVEVEHHQWRSYGGWSWALTDYIDMNIMTRLDDPNMVHLQENVDPFFYRDRLTMPKLVVNAVLDEFQQPDDTRYWWDKMPGPKHFIMTPNAEHSEATGIFEIVPAITSYLNYLLHEEPVPTFTWDIDETTGTITATLDGLGDVKKATMWYAYSCGNNGHVKRRDFRIASMDDPCHCGIGYDGYCANLRSFWHDMELQPTLNADGMRTYTAHMDAPDDGRWVAYFIDIKYEKPSWGLQKCNILPCDMPGQLEFTTEVSVWPNTFPYPDCYLDSCAGDLV